MKTYYYTFRLGFSKAFQYKINFYMGLVSIIFPLTIQIFLWKGMFASTLENTIFGYTFFEMITYAVLACLIAKVNSVNFVYEINEDIKNGGLVKYIIRPVNYRVFHFFSYLGEKVSMIICSAILIIGTYIVGNYLAHGFWNIGKLICFLPALAFGMILNFLVFYMVSGLGFWMQDASGVIFITTLVGNIISGGIFPLDIFPQGMQYVLKILPFSYTTYFPISILCDTINMKQIAVNCLMQLIWIFICLGVSEIIWQYGLKRYTAVGG